MPRPALKAAATHATALLVGALLALQPAGLLAFLHRDTGRSQSPSPSPSTTASAPADPASSHTRFTSRAAAFREAWRQLSLRPVTREERLLSQQEMLRRWAEFDLEGALHAAMAEGGNIWSISNNAARLTGAFDDAFTKHPAEAWNILAKGQLGFGQFRLEDWWLRTLSRQPETVIARFTDMTAGQQKHAMNLLTEDASFASDENIARLKTALLKSGVGDPQLADLLITARCIAPSASLDWTSLPAGPDRTAGRLAWAARLGTLDPAAYAAAWDTVPEADRAEVARLTLRTLGSDSPVILPALDHLIATGQWSLLANEDFSGAGDANSGDPFSPNPHASSGDPGLRDWAMKLPDRPEAADFFRNLLLHPDPFSTMTALPPDAGAIPAGTWQHDEALLMLTGSATDAANAQAFAAQITDPARQQRAQAIVRRAALLRSMR